MHLNIEIKARCQDPTGIRSILQDKKADFRGTDHQVDTYFVVPDGRLKLREGNIENALIHYRRSNRKGPKRSEVHLYKTSPAEGLKEVLNAALDTKVVVDKNREIYFIENVKFHIDTVRDLGSFIEIEAIDLHGDLGEQRLREQCDYYLQLFGITEQDLIEVSYSDLLLNKR